MNSMFVSAGAETGINEATRKEADSSFLRKHFIRFPAHKHELLLTFKS